MRIALYLAGHVRTYDKYIEEKILEHFKGHDLDVFISTHTTLDRSTCKHMHGHDIHLTREQAIELFGGLPVKNLIICDDYQKYPCLCTYGLAEYCLPSEKRVSDRLSQPFPAEFNASPLYCDKCKPENAVKVDNVDCSSMWKNVWNCHMMAKDYERSLGFKYDYYVRSRPDIIIMQQIDYTKLPPLTDGLLFGFGTTLGFPDDMFAVGKGEAMDDYCDFNKVIENCLYFHEVTLYTTKKYPILGQVQLAIVRFRNESPNGMISIPIEDNKFLLYYPRERFNTTPIPYV